MEKLLTSRRPKSALEIQCIQRLISDLKHGHERGLIWDEDAAALAVRFFSGLKHWKGEYAGHPFALEPWQEECIVAPFFGWKRQDGTRRFREIYVEIPRKNGKTTLLAGVGLILLVADGEQGAEIYTAATKKDQARIVFKDACNLVKSSTLSKHIDVFRCSLYFSRGESVFMPLSADYNTQDGLNPHSGLVDELHQHPSRDLWDVIKQGMGSRRQPSMWGITTAGSDQNSFCYEQRAYAERILDPHSGFVDDSFLSYVATIDKGDDWADPAVWWKSNPNLNISVKRSFLEEQCKIAKEQPSFQNNFRRFHLNEWTQQSERWLDLQAWDECLGVVDFSGECCGGLDLSTTTDLTAIAWAFRNDDSISILMDYFIPEENMIKREHRDRVPYSVWVKEGWITATPGNVIDYQYVRAKINERTKQFKIRELAFDPYNAAQLVQQLHIEDGINCLEHRQGYISMSGPSKEFERLVLSRKIRHGGNPVLRWNADCVSIAQDPTGSIKPVKPDRMRSGKRIDGIVAAIMAVGRGSLRAEEIPRSPYGRRGVISFEM